MIAAMHRWQQSVLRWNGIVKSPPASFLPFFPLSGAILALSLWAPPVRAQSMHEILLEAQEYDSQVDAAKAVRLQKGDIALQERAKLLPQLSAIHDRRRIENTVGTADPKAYRSTNSSFSLRQELFNWADWQGYKQGKLGEIIGAIGVLQAEQALRLRVVVAYIGALAAREDVTLFDKRIQSQEELLHAVNRRYEEGSATIIDVSQAKAELTSVRSQAVASVGTFDIALADIGELVGHPVTLQAGLRDDMPVPDFSPSAMQRWLAKAEENDFDVQLRRLAVRSSEYEIAKAKARFYPTADLVGNYSKGKSIFPAGVEINNSSMRQVSNSLGVTISIPLFNGFGSMGGLSQARHLTQQANAELSTARHAAKSATSRAFMSSRTSVAQIEAGKAAVESAKFAFDAVSKGYAYGKKSLTDIELASNNLFQANRNRAKFQYDFYLNYFKLMSSAGELDSSYILTLSGNGASAYRAGK